MTPQDLIKITGEHQLFLGINTYKWSLDQFHQAAQFAKQHDVDCLLVKVADGGNVWYGGLGNWENIKQAILAEGVGAIPYIYSYGDTFGGLDTEIDIMIAHMQDSGIVCVDAESEWNGQTSWAQHLCSRIQPVPGTFLVSTWADPSIQNWNGVIQALAPCTTVFMPQQYNNYLMTFWREFAANGATWLQPTVNLTQDFGQNDPEMIAGKAHDVGHTAISVWYYDTAVANPGLLDQIFAAFPKGGNTSVMNYGPDSGDFDNYFVANARSWTCKQTNAVIQFGNLALFAQLSIAGQLPVIGLPLESEQYHTESDGYTWSSQQFERATIYYDPAHRFDSQPGMGTSYLAHVNPPQTVEKIPDTLIADISALDLSLAKLKTDAKI